MKLLMECIDKIKTEISARENNRAALGSHRTEIRALEDAIKIVADVMTSFEVSSLRSAGY